MSSNRLLILYGPQYTDAQAVKRNSPWHVLMANQEKHLGQGVDIKTFHVIIERTLITPSDPPKAISGPSPVADLDKNSILQTNAFKKRPFMNMKWQRCLNIQKKKANKIATPTCKSVTLFLISHYDFQQKSCVAYLLS